MPTSDQAVSDWVGFAFIFVVAMAILGPLFWSLSESKKLVPIGYDGWITTRRSIFDHVIGAIQIGFSVVWLLISSLALIALEKLQFGAVFIFLLMLIMGLLFLQNFLFVYCARIRFNDQKIEYKALWRDISVFWNEVELIGVGLSGPEISTFDGKFSVSNMRRGFYQLLIMARENGVAIQDNPHLRVPISAFREDDTR